MGCSCGWRSQSPFDYTRKLSIRANGGFIQVSKVLILCHWGNDPFSNKHCLPCINCNEKQKKTHKCLLTLTKSSMGTEFFFYMVELARFMVDSFFSKVSMEMHQALNERGVLLIAVFGKILRDKTFMNSIYVLQRLQLTAVYCNRRGV